jgi:phage repressor protein C with HTH and peptisase S24 domain
MELKDRLNKAIALAGIKKQQDIVDHLNNKGFTVSKGTVSNWIGGRSSEIKDNDVAIALSDYLGVDFFWLITGEGDAHGTPVEMYEKDIKREESIATSHYDSMVSADGAISIPQFDTGGAMGASVVLKDQPGIITSFTVSRDWIRQNVKQVTSVNNLAVVTGFGDSMRPMYNPGDPLLVDAGVKEVDLYGVYFFRVGDEGFIKKLQRIPGEGIIVISVNQDYRDWTIKPDMDFEVFGRVVKAWSSEDY